MKKQKKSFFARPSAAHILSTTNNREVKEDFWENIINIKENESITLIGKLFESSPKEFLKRGPLVFVPTRDVANPKLRPFEIRQKVFDELKNHPIKYYRGFSYTPQSGVDFTPRIIRLSDILEGAKLYAYAPIREENFRPSTQIRPLDAHPKDIGAELIVRMPSRTKGERKYTIKFAHVPIINDRTKHAIAPMLKIIHTCYEQEHEHKFRVKRDPDFVSEYRFDEHANGAYYLVMDYYQNRDKYVPGAKPIIVPIEMNMIGIPSPLLLKAYDNMQHRVLIKETATAKPHVLREAELAALPWEGIEKEGYEKTLYLHGLEMKLGDFKWTKYER